MSGENEVTEAPSHARSRLVVLTYGLFAVAMMILAGWLARVPNVS